MASVTVWPARVHKDPLQRATVLCGRKVGNVYVCREWIATVFEGRVGLSPGYVVDAEGVYRLSRYAQERASERVDPEHRRVAKYRTEPGNMPGARASITASDTIVDVVCAKGHRNRVDAAVLSR